MRKIFNITGLCVKDKHYMIDTTEKVKQIMAMVERGDYFTINRPRQFGKTTTLNLLRDMLSTNGYLVIDTSFEGIGDNLFRSEEEFSREILGVFADSIETLDSENAERLLKYTDIKNFRELSRAIKDFVSKSDKKVVLLIDEVDKSSNSKVFLQFLGLLRNKYLASNAGKNVTFQSVILAGLHDIRTLKLAVRDENETQFNSPWNISAKFDLDMTFSAKEIEHMLIEYKSENNVQMNTKSLSQQIYRLTSGYPYLVSDICKIVDEKLGAIWSEETIYTAVKNILLEKNTLFEDVIKNIENNDDIKIIVESILVLGKHFEYHPMVHDESIIYGICRRDENNLVIHNSIFETYIYTYLVGKREIAGNARIAVNNEKELADENYLYVDKILLKFQDFMFEEFRTADEKFYEAQARLIFLAYLKPILNGRGFYFVEPQTRENKRLDIVVVYEKQKYVIELKIWNGQKYHEKGMEQLADYLKIQNLENGYLLVFNFNRNKEKSSTWLSVNDKKLFEVIV